MNTKDVKKLYDDYVLPTYTYESVCLVKGKGSRVWDIEGREYLDFFPGWAVSGLGHCHPKVVAAIKHQASKMLHISNNFLNLKQARLAEAISQASFPAHVFFCNSGAEAVEGAVKFVRKFANDKKKKDIITMKQSFHGRTLAALTATGQVKYHNGFDPLAEGFTYVPFNCIDSLRKTINDQTAAVLLEPIQGEGGIHVASEEYMQQLRSLCDKHNALLVFDEVQTGMGRTGKMFAYQHFNIEPDLMTLAKSLGGGAPIGALVVNKRIKNYLSPGTHASTFGGNPLVTAAGLAVFEAIKKENLLKNVNVMGEYLGEKLLGLKEKYSDITDLRGLGLMIGLQFREDATVVQQKALEKGLLINCTQKTIIRMAPALTVTKSLIDKAVRLLDEAIGETR